MLILTRRIGEIIRIGDDITVTVLAVKGSQVKFGTCAPNDVNIHERKSMNEFTPKASRLSPGRTSIDGGSVGRRSVRSAQLCDFPQRGRMLSAANTFAVFGRFEGLPAQVVQGT